MKKNLIFILIFPFYIWTQDYQWSVVNRRDKSATNSIHFTQMKAGWATGAAGFIWKSTDNGENWEYLRLDNHPNLVSVFAVDPDTAWCLSESGNAYKTDDKGISWHIMKIGNENDLECSDIFVTQNNHIFIFGIGINNADEEIPTSFFYSSTDGGNNWTKTIIGKETFALRKAILTADGDFYVSGFWDNYVGSPNKIGLILFSDNNGLSWAEIYNDTTLHDIDAITVINSSNILAIGGIDDENSYERKVIKTTNAGTTWDEVSFPPNTWGYNDIFFYKRQCWMACWKRENNRN